MFFMVPTLSKKERLHGALIDWFRELFEKCVLLAGVEAQGFLQGKRILLVSAL